MFQRKSDGFWVETVKIGGKMKRISAKSKSALQKKLRDIDIRQERGELFSEVAKKWEIVHSEGLQATTAQSYAPHIKRMITFFEGVYINEISPAQCQGFIDHLVAQDFSRDSVHRALSILRMIFTFAIAQPGSTLRFNPAESARQPRGLKHTRREPPTPEQLLKLSQDSASEMGVLVHFLIFTGLRRGEVLGLQWQDVDLEKREIRIHQRLQFESNQGEISQGAKSAAGIRTVPILEPLAAVLHPGKPKDFVFGGDKPLTASAFRHRWLNLCKEIGLAEATEEAFTGRNGHRYTHTVWKPLVTPHQLRHQFATTLFYAGIDELETRSVMGHASIQTTREIYQHIQQRDHEDRLAEKLNAYLAQKKDCQSSDAVQ